MNDDNFTAFEFEPVLSPAQVEAIADELERDTGRTIDTPARIEDEPAWPRFIFKDQRGRAAFGNDLNEILVIYLARKTKKWGRREGVMWKRAYRRCRDFRSSLQQISKNELDFAELCPEMLERLERWEPHLKEMLELFDFPSVRARPSDGWVFVNLIHDLGAVYENATKLPPGTSSTPGGKKRGGPFVRFGESIMKIIEPDHGRKALGSSISGALSKFRQPPQPGD